MTRTRLMLGTICAVALLLRLAGLQFGLPAVYNPDEIAILARALGFAKGTLNPHNFLYPTLYFYVLFAWVGAYLAVLFATGRVAGLAALQETYVTRPTALYTAGRSLGVLAGTLTVWLVYRLGARIGGARTAAAAALFLAVSPLHVRDSHYIKHDVPATLAVVAAYLAMARLWSRTAGDTDTPVRVDREQPHVEPGTPSYREAILAGAACGVAFSTHYYCVFLALPLAWSVVVRWKGRGLRTTFGAVVAAATASAVMFVALSPFLLVEPLTAIRDMTANRQIVVDRAVAAGAFRPALRYAEMLWRDTMGAPVVLLAVVGAVWMAVTDRARAIWLLAFPVPFLIFIVNTAPASRYLNPVLPFIALFAGRGLAAVASRLRVRPLVFWTALGAASVPGAEASIRADLFFRQADTRTLAQAYIESHVRPGAGILIQPYSVSLQMDREALKEALAFHLGDSTPSPKFQLLLNLRPYPTPAYRLIYLGSGGLDVDKLYVRMAEVVGQAGLNRLRRLGVAFVVFKRYNESDPETSAFLASLAREARRVATFSPYKPGVTALERAEIEPFLHNTDTRIDRALERPGPPLEIWQLDGIPQT